MIEKSPMIRNTRADFGLPKAPQPKKALENREPFLWIADPSEF